MTRHRNHHEPPTTAVPPDALGAAGDNHAPAALSGRDGKQTERGASHSARTGPVDEPPRPVREAPGVGDEEPRPAGILPRHDRDQLGQRLRHAVADFVDDPRRAVKEAADVLDDTGDRLTASLDEHRRTLRASAEAGAQDTEELRLALRTYREMTEQLLRI